jgi:transposase
MYPIDRRALAKRTYLHFQSLRKTAFVLQTSHTTISRWLKNPERARYPEKRKQNSKAFLITNTIKLAIQNTPFISLFALKQIAKQVHGFDVSRELLRTVIKRNGLSKKKPKFFSKPLNQEEKVHSFLQKRKAFVEAGSNFISLDETSFGRHGLVSKGYAPIGKPLVLKRAKPRVTTTSTLVAISENEILKREQTPGSFNTQKFLEFLKTLECPSGTVILLDNVAFHHSKVVKELIEFKGWHLLYVPPYSPWFNPIEGVFSIVKRHYYKHGFIDQAFQSVDSRHIEAFFKKAMETQQQPFETI